jgi:hypothetical protein
MQFVVETTADGQQTVLIKWQQQLNYCPAPHYLELSVVDCTYRCLQRPLKQLQRGKGGDAIFYILVTIKTAACASTMQS